MANTPRASSSWQGNRPLADTGSGSPGELTGTERLKLQSLAAIYALGAGLQLVGNTISTTIANATQSVAGLMSAADKAKLDGIAAGAEVNPAGAERDATAAQNGLMSAAYAGKLDGIQAGAQVNPGLATSGANGLMSSTYADKLNKVGNVSSNYLASEGGLTNANWSSVLNVQAPAGSTYCLVTGNVTFRNVSGSDGIGYFRVRRTDTNGIVASGQIEVRNNQRATIGYAGTCSGGVDLWLEVRTSVAGTFNVTHVNGLSDGGATTLVAVSQY